MSPQAHSTLRHILWAIAALVAFFVTMAHLFPAPGPIHAPVAVQTASPVEREVQALIDANKALAAMHSTVVSPLQQPAVTILKDTGLVNGLTGAQVAQILSALKPKTVEAIAVHTAVKAPTPAPTPSDPVYQHVFDAAYAADTKALNATTIKTSVDITRQEIPPSRVGSLISADGSGLSYAVWRRKQYEANIAAVTIGSHVAPAACASYLLPHTSLAIGPCVYARSQIRFGFGAVVHF